MLTTNHSKSHMHINMNPQWKAKVTELLHWFSHENKMKPPRYGDMEKFKKGRAYKLL